MATITIRDLHKSFNDSKVLEGIDLSIADGEFIALVGPSGCGKSTLLRIIAGLEDQTNGSIRIGNRPADGVRACDRDVAMVFQSYALYPHLTVAENIAVPLRMRQFSVLERQPLVGRLIPGNSQRRDAIARRVRDAAHVLGIESLLDRKPGKLSGGQRQRVALGRAMVRDPVAFLLDEPLSNLDAKLRVQMRAEITALHRRLGTTFVYVTHDQVEAMTMSDRIALLMDGELVQLDTPARLYADPNDIRAAEFIGSPKINTFPGSLLPYEQKRRLCRRFALDEPDTLNALTIGIRPEHLSLHPASGDPHDFRASIVTIEDLGCEKFVHLDLQPSGTRVIARTTQSPGYEPADTAASVCVRLDSQSMLLFAHDGRRLRGNSQTSTDSLAQAV